MLGRRVISQGRDDWCVLWVPLQWAKRPYMENPRQHSRLPMPPRLPAQHTASVWRSHSTWC